MKMLTVQAVKRTLEGRILCESSLLFGYPAVLCSLSSYTAIGRNHLSHHVTLPLVQSSVKTLFKVYEVGVEALLMM